MPAKFDISSAKSEHEKSGAMIETRPGVWWTSKDPTKRVPGTLVRENSLWRLDLVGKLPVDHGWAGGLSLVPPVTVFGSSLGTRCTLRGAYLSDQKGPTMHFGVPADDRDQGDNQYCQSWTASMLMVGEALPDDTLYKAAYFELTGLGDWWTHTGLTPGDFSNGIENYQSPVPADIDCGDGLEVIISTGATGEGSGRRARSLRERVVVHIKAESGLTLSDLERRLIFPLRALLAIVLKTQVEYSNCRLDLLDSEEYSPFPVTIDPDVMSNSASGDHYWPTFTAAAVDLPVFLPAWLRLAADNAVPLGVAESRDRIGSLPIRVVQTVNAAETLHRTLTQAPAQSPFADRVKEALKGTNLNSDERRKVCSVVKMSELSLETRLVQLAEGLGNSFCAWFFGNQVQEWAHVAAAVRNALSHGYPTKHGLERDTGTLVGLYRLTVTVIRLRLLCEAGLPSGDALISILMKDQSFLALIHQDVADWHSLAARIRASKSVH